MTSRPWIVLPDDTKCYSGPSCRIHGQVAKQELLQARISELLSPSTDTEKSESVPEWWESEATSRPQSFQKMQRKIEALGATRTSPIHWHKIADLKNYLEVQTATADTQLIIHVETDSTPKHTCRAWMYKQGKPVAMLKFSTYKKDYKFPNHPSALPESIINTVEVHPDHSGNGYALAIIREIENNVLGGRLIHSGGSYTPEGRAALGGKLPYTEEANFDQRHNARTDPSSDPDGIPEATFDSMRFVGDWDTLRPETIWEEAD